MLQRSLLGLLLLVACAVAHGVTPVVVRLIAINDLHGHLEPGQLTIAVPDPGDASRTVPLAAGGVAHLATMVGRLRREQPFSVFVSTGDLIGASPLVSGLFFDEPTIEAMNAVGLEVNAVGNHEFDRGADELLRMIRGGCREALNVRASCVGPDGRYGGARFAFLAANVLDAYSGLRWLPATRIHTFDGIQLGFIGAVTRATPGIVTPRGIAGLRFVAEAPAINAAAAQLKAQGVQAIVAVIHEGGEADGGINDCRNPRGPIFDIVRQLDTTVDIVLSGHSHRAYRCVIDGRLVMQGASFGRLVSVVDVPIDRHTGVQRERVIANNLPVANGRDAPVDLQRAYPPLPADPAVARLIAHYAERAAPLAQQVLGRIGASFDLRPSAGGDHALGRVIADAQLHATREHGAEIAFTNPGGARADLVGSSDGSVTFADVYAAQPFGNTLVTLTLTGAQLRTLLEQQWSARSERARMLQPSRGFSYTWQASRPLGERVIADSLQLNGRRIQAERSYRVTVNDYLAAGGDGFRVLRDGRDAVGGPLDVDALADYLRAHSAGAPLAPDRSGRIQRRP